MVCTPRTKIGLIGGMYFAGWASTLLVATFLADKYGRKYVWLLSIVVTAATIFGMFVSKSLNFTIVLQFIIGMASTGRTQVGFIYANEFLPPKWRVIFGSSCLILDGLTAVWLTTYFGFISNQYIVGSIFGLLFAIYAIIGTVGFATESPLWLLKMGHSVKSASVLRRIMVYNRVPDCEAEIQNLEKLSERQTCP